MLRRETLIAVTARMRFCTIACSNCVGQGTATRKKKTGNAKCHTHGQPPARKIHTIDTVTAMTVSAQLNKRQSGFASATNRIGKKRRALKTTRAIGRTREFGG